MKMRREMLVMMIICEFMIGFSKAQLRVGFYNNVCPNAESIVGGFVRDAAKSDSHIPAIMLRLHFHDCFVEGCDGSILIDGVKSQEKSAFGHQGVQGFDVIENAKAKLESVCPGVVSCADIVAMAARDAVAISHGPAYEVETGRKDGLVSNVELADRLPDVKDSIQLLKQKFFEKGLNDKDLVLLSAAHTIGTTACFFMTQRLYNFKEGGGFDPSINPSFLPELTSTCPKGGDVNLRLPMDRGSGETFDNQILQNIRSGLAVLQSDAQLMDDPTTKGIVNSYFETGASFEADFVNSIVKMGRIGTKDSSNGNIRRVCSSFN
ncbi:peroxidase 43-like [Cynara cardunculus var. scolymus]|uniref:peroxidase 43-like n=1 Tax=Cynara cardunculus var. scolymus TaxID=59895 RepID=UPI000D6242A3|nr:peroxidase 43-like [Cynara cardunculus var. scolymus]